MKKPKGMTAKIWKRHLAICDMNREIIKFKKKDPLYVANDIDEMLEGQLEYKANRKKKRK